MGLGAIISDADTRERPLVGSGPRTRRAAEPAPERAFVMAPRQNHFFREVVDALCAELETLGVTCSIHVGLFPRPERNRVYVLAPPHEYYTIMHGLHGPPPEVLSRTIFICAEQPGTSFLDHTVRLAPSAGAVFNINRLSVREFARHGIDAEHLQLGWSKAWDHD